MTKNKFKRTLGMYDFTEEKLYKWGGGKEILLNRKNFIITTVILSKIKF